MNSSQLFSKKLQLWLNSKSHKTFQSLNDTFAEKSFAVAVLILMVVPALPLPTGGITHIFEIIAMLLAGEMMLGFNTIWLPHRWRSLQPGAVMEKRAIPKLVSLISWFEKRFAPHNKNLFNNVATPKIHGLLLFIFVFIAFIAPPFSGLDTLPSLGAVIISMSIILDNLLLTLIGVVVGSVGLALIIALGKIVLSLF